jgi:alpha-tubulin suppressor-like RCC1 family protein
MGTVTLKISAAALAALSLWPATALAGQRPPATAQPTTGEVQHWGAYFGDGLSADSDVTLWPTGVSFPDTSPVIQVGTSNAADYALLADGTLWAWGQGTNGELGDGSLANSFTTPVQVNFPAGVQIAFIATDAMPYDTGLAVDTNGNAWGWGLNGHGELCLGNKTAYALPVQLPLTGVTALAGASGHAVYDSGGTLYSCGSNWNGVLGTGAGGSSTTPVRVTGLNGQDVVALVSAFGNAGALLADGQYYDWGYDAAGQLGDGTTGTSSSVPVQVALPSPVTQVAQGGSNKLNGQTLVMLADGSLYAWGSDTYSQLGDGGTTAEASPVPFSAPAGVTYSALATGGATSYAIAADGTGYAWGLGSRGQLGNGTKQTATVPTRTAASPASLISSTAYTVVVK